MQIEENRINNSYTTDVAVFVSNLEVSPGEYLLPTGIESELITAYIPNDKLTLLNTNGNLVESNLQKLKKGYYEVTPEENITDLFLISDKNKWFFRYVPAVSLIKESDQSSFLKLPANKILATPKLDPILKLINLPIGNKKLMELYSIKLISWGQTKEIPLSTFLETKSNLDLEYCFSFNDLIQTLGWENIPTVGYIKLAWQNQILESFEYIFLQDVEHQEAFLGEEAVLILRSQSKDEVSYRYLIEEQNLAQDLYYKIPLYFNDKETSYAFWKPGTVSADILVDGISTNNISLFDLEKSVKFQIRGQVQVFYNNRVLDDIETSSIIGAISQSVKLINELEIKYHDNVICRATIDLSPKYDLDLEYQKDTNTLAGNLKTISLPSLPIQVYLEIDGDIVETKSQTESSGSLPRKATFSFSFPVPNWKNNVCIILSVNGDELERFPIEQLLPKKATLEVNDDSSIKEILELLKEANNPQDCEEIFQMALIELETIARSTGKLPYNIASMKQALMKHLPRASYLMYMSILQYLTALLGEGNPPVTLASIPNDDNFALWSISLAALYNKKSNRPLPLAQESWLENYLVTTKDQRNQLWTKILLAYQQNNRLRLSMEEKELLSSWRLIGIDQEFNRYLEEIIGN